MREEDTLKELQKEIVIPDIVQKKANEAFAQIRGEEQKTMREQRRNRHFWGKKAVAVAAVVVLAGGATAVGASMHWSDTVSKKMSVTEEQKTKLEEKEAPAFVMQSQTHNGVTVTAEQSITDNYFVHIGFKIEGYQLPEGMEPGIENINFSVGGKDDCSLLGGGFYDGLTINKDGDPVYDDGSPVDLNADTISRYVQDDGSMMYWITLSSDEKGYFLNKDIHIELENIGTVDQADFDITNMVEGKWAFDWNLKGTDSYREVTFDGEQIGNTGAKMIKAEISPISMHVEYQFPKQTHKETVINGETGEEEEHDMENDGPYLAGVKMKDGTVYPYLHDGGSEGFEKDDTYEIIAGNDRIIDPDQVEYLMFVRTDCEMGETYSDDYYDFVKVN
ncbi:MAG: DUF4179 domain-containing protein [Lachnospiraceae bacterium]